MVDLRCRMKNLSAYCFHTEAQRKLLSVSPCETELAKFLTWEVTERLIDDWKETFPILVDKLVSDNLRVGKIRNVLRLLLQERIPIRPPILEALLK